MFFTLILTLVALACGTLATYLYDRDATFAARLVTGACLGMAALALVGFVISSVIGLTPLALALTALVLALPFVLLLKPEWGVRSDLSAAWHDVRRAALHPTFNTISHCIFYALVSYLLWRVFGRAMFERDGGIYTGYVNNLGDLPFHLQVITSFAHGQNFPPEDPTYAGTRFAYPYFADFVAAMFVRAGASLRDAMLVQNFVLAFAFVGVLHRWVWEMTRDRIASMLSPVLIFLSGGLGWWMLFREAREGGQGLFALLEKLPHDYTIMGNSTWRWGNAITTLLVTQRSILFGLPLAVIVFTQWWIALGERDGEKLKSKDAKGGTVAALDEKRAKRSPQRRKGRERRGAEKKSARVIANGEGISELSSSSLTPAYSSSTSASQTSVSASSSTVLSFFPLHLVPSAKRMLAAGLITGMLPLIHAHSFIVVFGMGGCVALIFREWREERWRLWAVYFAAALLIAMPEMWWATHGSSAQAGTFFGWEFGWDHGKENIVWFWFKNTGLLIPLIVAAMMWRNKREYLLPRRMLLFYLPFTLCFIVPNMMKLAPWVWDNIKVLFYWYVASVPLVALLLSRLWRSGAVLQRVAAAGLLVALTLAGALDVWRICSETTEYREFDRDGVTLAQKIIEVTPPRALVLHAPTYNPVVFLSGRRSLLGYTGHIWAHGLDYVPRENDIKRIYAGVPDAVATLARYGIDYVVVSPLERGYMPVNDKFFERYPKVGEAGEYRLYKITR
jgi:hypothetical protein